MNKRTVLSLALARFSSCGGEYAESPLLIFDLRGNGGCLLPDLWVEPVTALDAVKRLIEYYGLG